MLRTTGPSPLSAGEEVAMPVSPLPSNPSIEHLRKDAKRLRRAVHAGDADALARVHEFHPLPPQALARFTLADAQLVTARSYGFASWAKLKQHLLEITPFIWDVPPPADPDSRVDVFVRLACLTYTGVHPSPARARRLLADHPEISAASIYAAAAAGDVVEVRVMLDREPRLLNAKGGPLQWEPLLYACYSRLEASVPTHSTLEVARLLLSRGADPNAGFLYEGRYAFTALTGAFGRGEDWPNQPPHPDCEALARLLLDAGADPNDAQTLYNRHFKRDDDHLKLLFTYGLGRDRGGPWLSRLHDDESTLDSLLVQQLCWAAIHNFPDRVKLLIAHGVDVNIPSRRSGRTAYEEALRASHHSLAEYLLQRGAKKIDLDPLETFALACIAGRREEVRARLAEDPELLERLGHQRRMDMLHRAVDAKQHDGVRLMIELGVDINGIVPGTGLDRAVLHNAAGWGSLEMVRLLVQLGADPNRRDSTYHGTAIAWALYNGQQQDVVDYLIPFATVIDAIRAGAVERVDALLRDNPRLAGTRDEEGNPLVFALRPEMKRLNDMIRLLVKYGADLNAQDSGGKTLLGRVLAHEVTDFADVLRAHGATA
jgi:ankyrin repeat protein